MPHPLLRFLLCHPLNGRPRFYSSVEALVGTVRWDFTRSLATFAYNPDFVKSGLNVAPLQMPLSARADQVCAFPD
jgi:hypothetical protein